jgi:hypothetical protein
MGSDGKTEEEKQIQEDDGWLLNKLSTITDNLDTYLGRDAMIVLLSYFPLIAADLCSFYGYGEKENYADNCVKMFLALSSCRVMLRLFDDCGCIREYYRFRKSQQIKVY